MKTIPDHYFDELHAALVNHSTAIPNLFQEHQFSRRGDGWHSPTYLNGEPHKRQDKTKITFKFPNTILEQGGETITILKYIQQSKNIHFLEAVNMVSDAAGFPRPEMNQEETEAFQEARRKEELLNGLLKHCNKLLLEDPAAENTRQYIASRGITLEEIQEHQLGYWPSCYELQKANIDWLEVLKQFNNIDNSNEDHVLVIPWYSNGRLANVKFRSIQENPTRKYLNWMGSKEGLYSLNGAKHHSRLVVVEGELDCIAANTMLEGIADAVAIGMLTLTQQQVEAAKRSGYSSFTLCLDSDAENNHAKETTQAIQLLMKNGINQIYIVDLSTFGGEKIDPAALRMQPNGKERFIAEFKNAKPFTEYMVEGIAEKYAKERSPEGELLERAKFEMQKEMVDIASTIPAMENRERFTNLSFKYFQEDGINFKSFQNTIEHYAKEREDAARQHEIKRFNEQLKEAVEKGNMARVGELTKAIQAIATTAATTTFPKPYSMEQWKHELQNQAPMLKTGWVELNTIVGFPAGGLSIIAGRPSHGKTTMMLNSIVRNVEDNPSKTFVYFNYEEPRAKIIAKLVNIIANKNFGSSMVDNTGLDRTEAMPREMERRNNIDYIEWVAVHGNDPDVQAAMKTLEDWMQETDGNPARLYVDCKTYPLEELVANIKKVGSIAEIGGIYIDYIQKIRPQKSGEIREAMIQVSGGLQTAAKDLSIPIIVGAQLNRGAASATGVKSTTKQKSKRPTLEQLKESGSFEEDANVVLAVWNNYREDGEAEDEEGHQKKWEWQRKQEVDFIVLKNREGVVNQQVEFIFDAITMNYMNKKNWDIVNSPNHTFKGIELP